MLIIANGPAKKSSARVIWRSPCWFNFIPTLNHGEGRGVHGLACGRYFFSQTLESDLGMLPMVSMLPPHAHSVCSF